MFHTGCTTSPKGYIVIILSEETEANFKCWLDSRTLAAIYDTDIMNLIK